ncbi:hypothetical protein KSP35_13155 [Aquihabitans sp. G128]|uniref:hypothetical protein n=1 Tax=Aquihabitans sp. G128 TaxID=2849779 RepID=UPI001C23E379|nr:hypothetical protein [Aquihabitans sp. G128]QXC59351.1 hypothetical protein KSP35_13155 [Aquihabitans sp. G128]
MNTPVILGIDPGKEGALAALDAATGALIWVEDMPDPLTGALVADLLANEVVVAAMVELQVGRPGQSSSAMFKFGTGYGLILGVLGALRIPYELATAGKWKANQRVTADKATSRRRAIELWPAHSELFKLVKHTDRAEAALIARYGWQRTAAGGAAA